MARRRVRVAYIADDSVRRGTFRKRKKGIMKKITELSTLCEVDACAIVYSPFEPQPEVWPSPSEVQRVLNRFRKMPEMERNKNMMNQEGFLGRRIMKGCGQFEKQKKENRRKDITTVMFDGLTGRSLDNLNMMDLTDLGWVIEQNLVEIDKISETIRKANHAQLASTSVGGNGGQPAPQQAEKPADQVEMDSTSNNQLWSMDFLNPDNPMGFDADEMILPFGNSNYNEIWSNDFLP